MGGTSLSEVAKIVVGVYKLAVRMSIGSGFIGVMFGLVAMGYGRW